MKIRSAGLSSALWFLCAAAAFGQAPTVVTTLPQPPSQTGFYGSSFTKVGDAIYFYSDPSYESAAIWKWTAAEGAVRVTSIAQDSYNYHYPAMMAFGDKLLFGGRVTSSDYELWITDGTPGGTTLVKDIYTGGWSSPVPVIVSGSKAYFTATDLEHGRELWVTDGTPAGTTLVADLNGSSLSSAPSAFVQRNGLVYFAALGQLYVTDGTAAGTVSLATGVEPASIGVMSDRVVFLGTDETNGRELWSTDGTPAGTALLKDINPGPAPSWGGIGASFVSRGSSLLFFAEDATYGRELWITDGTADGTALVKDVTPGPHSSQFEGLVASDEGAFFIADGTTLWFTDGTEAGTIVLASYTSVLSIVTAPNGAYLLTDGPTSTLIFSDGTVDGTISFPDIDVAAPLRTTGGVVLFNAPHETYGAQPWITDGTEAGTYALTSRTGPVVYMPPWIGAAGNNAFMRVGARLFRSDGTAAGTFAVDGPELDNYYYYESGSHTSVGNLFLFKSGGSGPDTAGLWKSDGSVAGTTLVKPFSISRLAGTSLGYALMYGRETPGCCSDSSLWRTDGTAEGTAKIRSMYEPHSFVEMGGLVYFLSGTSSYSGSALWRTGGTAETTSMLLPDKVAAVGAAGGRLYLSRTDSAIGLELWTTDGTADGVALVKDINPGDDSSAPSSFASLGKLLIFTADDGVHGRELWRSDGTDAGTFLLRDIIMDGSSGHVHGLTQSGRYVYFVAQAGSSVSQLWRTDGTVAGTILLSNVTQITSMRAADGKLVFVAQTPPYGTELWESDGTTAGTFLVADLVPGTGSIFPFQLVLAGERLIFSTSDARLWTRPRATSRLTIADRSLMEGDSGSTVVQFTVTREGSTAGAATVNYTTEDMSAAAGADYEATAGQISFADGETSKQISVTVVGDTALEQNEAFGVLLTTATGATIVRDRAIAIIEEDDRKVALSLEYVPTYSSYDGRRVFRIANAGPSTATVTLHISESPYTGSFHCGGNPSVCSVGAVPAGESVDFVVRRGSGADSYSPVVPGRTLTARVSAVEAEDDVSDNETVRMIDVSGTYSLPPYLVSGTTDSAQMTAYTFPSQVSLFLAGGVIVSPSSALLTEENPIATFGLTIAPDAWGWANVVNGSQTVMRVPLVLPNEDVKLDTTVITRRWTELHFEHDEPVVLPITIVGVLPDGTHPSGVVSLRLRSDNALVQSQVLDADGKATFTLTGLEPGGYSWYLAYGGDAYFHAVDVPHPIVEVRGRRSFTNITVQENPCGTSQIVVTVTSDGEDTPAGTVTIDMGSDQFPNLPLVATGRPGEAQVSISYTFSTYYAYMSATYNAVAPLSGSSDSHYVYPKQCAPPTLIASAASETAVSLMWSDVGADQYEVRRAAGPSIDAFTVIGTTASTSFTDASAAPGTTYLYHVAATSSTGVVRATSASEIATTVIFTDDPIVFRSTRIKAVHVLELRRAANALRALTGQAPYAFAAIVSGMPVAASEFIQIRSVMGAALSAASRRPVAWLEGLEQGKPVKALHIQQMRNVVK